MRSSRNQTASDSRRPRSLRRARRLLVGIVTIAVLPLTVAAPGSAATLTATSYTASNTLTGTAGVRDDWGFTTATTNMLSRVTMGMPAGTTGPNRYLALNGVTSNDASTPDSPANSITGDIDIRVKTSLTNWGAGTAQMLATKRGGGTSNSWSLAVVGGNALEFAVSTDGSTLSYPSATFSPPANNTPLWLRVARQVSSGTIKFYSSLDGTTWTSLGTNTVAAGTGLYDSNAPVAIGAYGDASYPIQGKVYYADIRNSINGTTTSPSACNSTGVANCFNPNNDTLGGSSWTSASASAETWTANRSGTNLPADIASDLSVAKVTGLPTGGTANYRSIDNVATYNLASATSIPSGTAVSVGLIGFTNPYTAGSYTSGITTYDNSSPPVSVDTATTASLAITGNTISTAYGLVPDYTTATAVSSVNTLPVATCITGTTMYVADDFTNVILKVNLTAGMATRFAGISGVSLASGDGGLATSAGLSAPTAMAVDSSGNLFIADKTAARIRKVTVSTGIITTVAGTGTSGFSGDGAAATAAKLATPTGVAVESNGDIYIADTTNMRIRKVDHTTGYISTVAGNGTATSTGDGAAATSATLNTPTGVSVDSNGDVYLTQQFNGEIRKITLSSGIISDWAGTGTSGFSGDGTTASSAKVSSPYGLVFAANGDAYFADSQNNRVRKVTASTGFISTYAGGSAGFSGDGSVATSATMNSPRFVSLDSGGNLYVADLNNSRVREISSGGTMSTYLGTGVDTDEGDGGPASAAEFYGPQRMATDAVGNIYVADGGNNRIRKIDQWGNVTTFAGNGSRSSSGYGGDGAAATSAQLAAPAGVAVAANGDVYIADETNNKVRKVDHTTGYISTFTSLALPVSLAINPVTGDLYVVLADACQVVKVTMAAVQTVVVGNGTCGYNVAAASDPTTVELYNPRDLQFDAAGDYYIADKDNARVRKVDAVTGALSTVAGGGASTANGVAATSASLSGVRSLAVDALGNVYVAEDGHYDVRKFIDGGPIVTVAGSGSGGYSGDGGAAVSAKFTNQDYLTISRGQLYLATSDTAAIRKVADIAPMAPNINADSMSVAMNTALTYPVESNDWDQDGAMDPNSVAITTAPAHGTAVVNTNQGQITNVTYTPATSYTGADSFVYQACDSTLVLCNTATVSITVGSNQVTTVVGPLTEGDASTIAFSSRNIARFRNYIFMSDSTYGVIRRYDTYSKQLVVVAGNGAQAYMGSGVPATSAQLSVRGLTFAPDGSLYFSDYTNNRIRSISPAGTITTVAGTGTATYPTAGATAASATVNVPNNLGFDRAGNLNFTTLNQVWAFPIGGTMTLVAGTTAGASGDGASPSAAQLNLPTGLVFAPDGDLFIVDAGNSAIRRIHNGTITTAAGTLGTSGYSGDGSAATSALLSAPGGITVDASGNLTVADTGNNVLRTFTDGGTISTVAGTSVYSPRDVVSGAIAGELWTASTSAPDRVYREFGGAQTSISNTGGSYGTYSGDNSGLSTQIVPDTTFSGTVADSSGNLYFWDATNGRIRRWDATTHLVSTVVSGMATTGRNGLVLDANGNLVFFSGSQIDRRNSDGSITVLAGTGTCGSGGDGGLATAATLCNSGLAYNAAGDLYIADSTYNRIRRIDHATGIITTVAGNGTATSTGDGGPAASATLNGPRNLAFDSAGNLYFIEVTGNRLRIIDTSGNINTVISTLSTPRDMSIDTQGNIFISNAGTNTIVEIVAGTSSVTTVAGSGTKGFVDNTTYTSAQVNTVSGLTVVGADIYMADALNYRIRKLSALASTTVDNVATAAWSVVPGASGHTNLREQFVVTPSATVTSSKLTFTLPTSTAGTPSVVSAYGVSGTVTPSLSGTTLTLSYPSQTFTAGVPVSFAVEGWTNGGSNGAYNSNVTMYDSAGSTAIGWARSNVVNISSSGAPSSTDPGYASVWMPSTTVSPSASSFAVSVNPASASSASALITVAAGGNLNGDSFGLGATTLTRTVSPFSTFAPVSAGLGTGVATGAFGADTWGSTVSTSTGTVQGGAVSGNFVGNTPSLQSFVAGASAINTYTLTARAKVDWLLPAGTYTSAVTYELSPGT